MSRDKIILKNVSKSFLHHEVVHDINMTMNKGEIVTFCGTNGSGKSTILKMISGLLHQDQGDITVFGISNKSRKIFQLCEFVMESGQGYYGYLSAYENARYFFGLNKIKYKIVEHDFHALCELFQFVPHLHKKIDELSQGNRQKFSLIISLLCDPGVLLLDEPTNGLDEQSIAVLANILTKMSKEKQLTILVTSHDTAFMRMINTRVIRIKEGRIEQDTSMLQCDDMQDDRYEISLSSSDEAALRRRFPELEIRKSDEHKEITLIVSSGVKQEIVTTYDVTKLLKLDGR